MRVIYKGKAPLVIRVRDPQDPIRIYRKKFFPNRRENVPLFVYNYLTENHPSSFNFLETEVRTLEIES